MKMEKANASRLLPLLVEIAAKHRFPLPEGGVKFLVPGDREQLIDVLLQEFTETGLGFDDEPNNRGIEIEELIDFVGSHNSPSRSLGA